MATPVSHFDYDLPEALIAQTPASPRESARLLLLDRRTGARRHLHVRDLPELLSAGDLLVFNDSKVFKARLLFSLGGREHELLLLRCRESNASTSRWEVLLRGAKKFEAGDVFEVEGVRARLLSKHGDGSGVVDLEIGASLSDTLALCDTHGHIPVPPYIHAEPRSLEMYQTAYAKQVGSVAAPTAGFHFTPELLGELRTRGVKSAFVTLHVGIGTFQPVKTTTIEEHRMHEEMVELPPETVEAIRETKARGGRVIAVGTTTVRTLEGVAALRGQLEPYVGDLNLFITPGFHFQVIDGLVTNFHLPKSTLLMLVSAFAGRERVLEAYREAVEKGYRFFSFGDAMFIECQMTNSTNSNVK